MYFALCAAVFLLAYFANIFTITVGYHRGLAHKALSMSPGLKRLIVRGGIWVTGLDPKAWVVMHRMHHAFSDTPDDPHSPTNVGLLGVGLAQLKSYKRTIIGLAKRDPTFTMHAKDLGFELSAINFSGRWVLPYLAHAAIAVVLGVSVGWLLAAAYFFGMMSHPIQGGLVNSLGHAVGPRNFDTPDDSRNNLLVGYLVFGEGYQNNHHRYPNSASFSFRPYELDLGYGVCVLLEKLRLAEIDHSHLIPTRSAARAA